MSTAVYSMPFALDLSSAVSSDIKRHFTDCIQERADGKLDASFRGRPLNGEHLTIPADYLGVLSKSNQPVSTFDRLTYFNLDCATSKNDCLARSVEYLSLAKVLHE